MANESAVSTDLKTFVASLSGVRDCAVAREQDQWIVAICSNGAVNPVEYRNLTWEHLGPDTVAPVIVLADPSTLDELTIAVVEQVAPERRSVYVAPRGDVEKFVCGTLAEATESVAVGVRDDLFALGVDSLVLIETSTSIFERYGVQLEMQEVFEAGDPAQISRLIDARSAP